MFPALIKENIHFSKKKSLNTPLSAKQSSFFNFRLENIGTLIMFPAK